LENRYKSGAPLAVKAEAALTQRGEMGCIMDFQQVLSQRYSCRKFQDKPVSRELLTQLVEAGRRAPSGCNLQPWQFIVVDDAEKRQQIAEAVYDPELKTNSFARDVPAFVVIVNTPPVEITDHQKKIIASCENSITEVDIGCTSMQICLAATNLGLGTVMMGKVRQQVVREALAIPEELPIPIIIAVGYPLGSQVNPRPRRPLEDVLRWNSFENNQ